MNTPLILIRSSQPVSVVLQRLRLDVAPHAAARPVHLIDGRLLQTVRVLGLGQRAVNGGFVLQGGGRGGPGHACQSGSFRLRDRPGHQGAANQRCASLSG